MTMCSKLLATTLVAAGLAFAGGASAADLGAAPGVAAVPAPVQTVQWRQYWSGPRIGFGFSVGPGYVGPGYYDDYAYSPGYYNDYAYEPGYTIRERSGADDVAYCMQRFRTYDPETGTYIGRGGVRLPCP